MELANNLRSFQWFFEGVCDWGCRMSEVLGLLHAKATAEGKATRRVDVFRTRILRCIQPQRVQSTFFVVERKLSFLEITSTIWGCIPHTSTPIDPLKEPLKGPFMDPLNYPP